MPFLNENVEAFKDNVNRWQKYEETEEDKKSYLK